MFYILEIIFSNFITYCVNKINYSVNIVQLLLLGPEGIPKDPAYSLKPLAQVFEEYLETPVIFLDDCVGFQVIWIMLY